jgi:hypothetical protein
MKVRMKTDSIASFAGALCKSACSLTQMMEFARSGQKITYRKISRSLCLSR